jgi:hypothetical protein
MEESGCTGNETAAGSAKGSSTNRIDTIPPAIFLTIALSPVLIQQFRIRSRKVLYSHAKTTILTKLAKSFGGVQYKLSRNTKLAPEIRRTELVDYDHASAVPHFH